MSCTVSRFGMATNDGQSLEKFLYDLVIVDFATRNVPVGLSEQAVLAEIQKNPYATYDDIARAIGKTRKTV